MIVHLLKLIWNRKRSNMLIILEIFFSFLVLFAISGLLIYNFTNYLKPLGFEYKNVWSLSLKEVDYTNGERLQNSEQDQAAERGNKVKLQYQRILNQLKMYPQVDSYSASATNVPYSFNTMNNIVTYGNSGVLSFNYWNDDHYPEVVGLKMVEGRWFNAADDASRLEPLVINQFLKDEFFKGEAATGKSVNIGDYEFIIVGVVEEYRSKGEYKEPTGVTFQRINPYADKNWHFSNILLKVKPGVGAEFEEKMMKDLAAIIPGWTMEISSLEDMRKTQHKLTWVPLIALSIVGGFLIINVVLGLFGVLWYNINRRYSEIGLRRATGATAGNIQRQFLGEILVLATFGLIIGCLIAVQFPLLNVFNVNSTTYFLAILISVFSIYALAAICAWYPGRQAAKIEPAVALHEE
jgi:putative ABC transport system permease protein